MAFKEVLRKILVNDEHRTTDYMKFLGGNFVVFLNSFELCFAETFCIVSFLLTLRIFLIISTDFFADFSPHFLVFSPLADFPPDQRCPSEFQLLSQFRFPALPISDTSDYSDPPLILPSLDRSCYRE